MSGPNTPLAASCKAARDAAWEGIAMHLRQVKDVSPDIGERQADIFPVKIAEHVSTDLSLASEGVLRDLLFVENKHLLVHARVILPAKNEYGQALYPFAGTDSFSFAVRLHRSYSAQCCETRPRKRKADITRCRDISGTVKL